MPASVLLVIEDKEDWQPAKDTMAGRRAEARTISKMRCQNRKNSRLLVATFLRKWLIVICLFFFYLFLAIEKLINKIGGSGGGQGGKIAKKSLAA
ncbi:hypothetical protein V9K67_26275 [Paraflavisolibacter sp. H34]|uniref:hypothetical protein n=1 Tax=Huijunlia imazamoxiresistens TaxID=3127457 RepID=UPI003016FE31